MIDDIERIDTGAHRFADAEGVEAFSSVPVTLEKVLDSDNQSFKSDENVIRLVRNNKVFAL